MRVKRPYIWLSVVLFFLLLADLMLGSVRIPPSDVLNILLGQGSTNTGWEAIILDFRLPRVVTAVIVGSGLAASGLLMQVMFRNPLAGPYVLGISTGASLGVAIVVLAGVSIGITWMSSWVTVLAATAGSLLVFLVVMVVSFRVRDSMTLLIFGLMLGSATGGIVAVLQYFSKAEDIQIYLLWTFGSLGNVTFEKLAILLPMVLLGIALAVITIKPLNLLVLGEQYARSSGINITRTRLLIVISTCIMAGSITAFCGPIAFIGIAVPHFARIAVPTSDHRRLLPLTLLIGALALVLCDIISQLPGAEEVLPINAVTALFGAPVVIWLIIRKKEIGRSVA